MTLGHALYQFIIGPIELVFETIYGVANSLLKNNGLAVLFLSLAMNLLLLPMYHRADAIQDQERETEKRLSRWVTHIKNTFHGDERYMMLQHYYKQNHYRPFLALRGSLPLLLEIPFFIAAYHFLSNLEELRGTAFGPVTDLGAPDALLTAGGLTINLLPVLMTLINGISSAIYLRGCPLKDKLKLYGMALLFLIILYQSPAGLVIYWTMNNLFSLVKNLIVRRKQAVAADRQKNLSPGTKTSHLPSCPEKNARLFFSGAFFLALLCGMLIPSAVILASPAEFVHITAFYSPLRHVLNASLLSFGLFVLWLGIFYYMAGKKGRRLLSLAVWMGSGLAAADYMFFGTGLGTMSAQLKYDTEPVFRSGEKLLNLAVLLAVTAVFFLIWKKRKQIAQLILVVLALAVLAMSSQNMLKINSSLTQIRQQAEQLASQSKDRAHFSLSRDGQNVVLVMLDRAIGSYLPYLFQEKPELEGKFSGFTYYPRTLSFGGFTNIAAPALFGGYEYTPEKINARSDVPLVQKHDEALKLMPVLFDKAGYEVTVCEPSYAGYEWIPDISIFDEYENINAYLTEHGQFSLISREEQTAQIDRIWERNFFCYSLMKCSPLILQRYIYRGGTYYSPDNSSRVTTQTELDMSRAEGLFSGFVSSYAFLCALPEITQISEGKGNTFLMMTNSTTHEPMMLQEPAYEPSAHVDNTEYDRRHQDRFTYNGRTLRVENADHMKHYQSNMAALLKLGDWLDYLRAEGVYNNTRIIIVADHGRDLGQFDDWVFGEDASDDIMLYNPLMLVKDFGDGSFKTDTAFMTNADVPLIAMEGLLNNPLNPFTGHPITGEDKYAGELHIFGSRIWDTLENNGNTFLPGLWYGVSGDFFDAASWRKLGEY